MTQVIGGFLVIVLGLAALAGIAYYGLARFGRWLLGHGEDSLTDIARDAHACRQDFSRYTR